MMFLKFPIQFIVQKLLLLKLCMLLCIFALSAQENSVKRIDPKFGGPMTTLSFNQHGPYLSIGGGGTFITSGQFYAGVFGQAAWAFLEREVDFNGEELIMQSRQTGFWVGYKFQIPASERFSFSIYNKTGFGKVLWEDEADKLQYYNSTFIFTPNLEISFRVTDFFELGLAGFYEFFTRVDLNGYGNKDLNSPGIGLLFKFRGDD